jgi:hypothetical protein
VRLLDFFTTAHLPPKPGDTVYYRLYRQPILVNDITSPLLSMVTSSVNEKHTHCDPIYYLSIPTVCEVGVSSIMFMN